VEDSAAVSVLAKRLQVGGTHCEQNESFIWWFADNGGNISASAYFWKSGNVFKLE
jgi:hypothetical protein